MAREIVTTIRQRGDNMRVVSRQDNTIATISNTGAVRMLDVTPTGLRVRRPESEQDGALLNAAAKVALAFRVGLQK